MSNSTQLYRQLWDYLPQHRHTSALRHLKALAWMVSALICSGREVPLWLRVLDHGSARAVLPPYQLVA